MWNILPFVGRGGGAVAYRYWRIWVTAVPSTTGPVNLSEIELRATLGGADLTSPSTPTTQSSFLASGYEGVRTIDNQLMTPQYWYSGGGNVSPGNPQWVRYDLGTSQVVKQLAIHPAGYTDEEGSIYGTLGYGPGDFIVQASNDDSTWTDIKAFTGVTYPTWTSQTFNL